MLFLVAIPTPTPTTAELIPSPDPTRVVVSTTLQTTSARKQDYDDVAEVTTNIIIENTDLTSLVGAGSQSGCSSPGMHWAFISG